MMIHCLCGHSKKLCGRSKRVCGRSKKLCGRSNSPIRPQDGNLCINTVCPLPRRHTVLEAFKLKGLSKRELAWFAIAGGKSSPIALPLASPTWPAALPPPLPLLAWPVQLFAHSPSPLSTVSPPWPTASPLRFAWPA